MSNNLEIIVPTKDLAHALSFASSVIEKRNVVDGLNNIKLVAENNVLEIGATDLDLYLNQEIGAEIINSGSAMVSIYLFLDIVRKIDDSEIRVKYNSDSNILEVTGENSNFELFTLPVEKFPNMEDVESDVSLTIACRDLARMLTNTNFAISSDETRYNLSGVYMHVKDNEFRCVATDGHRLSLSSTNIENNSGEFGVIVPSKTVIEILKIAKDSHNLQSDMKITLSDTKIKFQCNKLVMVSKLIDANFPEYSVFIPVNNQNKLSVNTKLISSAVARVDIVTMEKLRAIKMMIGDQKVKMTASGETKGSAQESILFSDDDTTNYCKFSGDDVTIGMNPRYISDVLNIISSDKVDIYFNDGFSPVLIKSEKYPNDNFVIMPVKV